MPTNHDPKGYYRALGLAPNATQAQIVHAYREWAKRYHPDLNDGKGASEFLQIKEAYDTLSDEGRRRIYDETVAESENDHVRQSTPQEGSSAKPVSSFGAIRCSSCGAVTAQPRFCVFQRVLSLVYYTRMDRPTGVYCAACARAKSIRESTFSWLFGWWSVLGIFETPIALWKNARLGDKPDKPNAHLLLMQGLHFAQVGQFELAHFCWEQARPFAHGDEADVLSNVIAAAPVVAKRPIRDQWRPHLPTLCVHSAPLIAAIGAVIWFGSRPEVGWPALARTDVRHVENATIAWIVQGSGYVSGGYLPRFSTLQHVRSASDPKFVVGQTHDGRTVTVERAALASGDGLEAKLSWCGQQPSSAPYNNEIFAQNQRGVHRISISNLGDYDAIAKFIDPNGYVALSIFVGARSTAGVTNFPDGDYRLEFATGRKWSQACGIFTEDPSAQTFPDFDHFASVRTAQGISYSSAEYTITPVANGNVRAQPLDLESFLSN